MSFSELFQRKNSWNCIPCMFKSKVCGTEKQSWSGGRGRNIEVQSYLEEKLATEGRENRIL
jgi:hypothetical protein